MNTEHETDHTPELHLSPHQAYLAKQRVYADALENFLLLHESKLPEDFGDCFIGYCGALFTFALTHRDTADRERALAYIGDTFGRSGWTCKPDVYSQKDDWTKVVDGVTLKIEGAKKWPEVVEHSVLAMEFPLQLS